MTERSAVDVLGDPDVLARNKLEAISWNFFYLVVVEKIELNKSFLDHKNGETTFFRYSP